MASPVQYCTCCNKQLYQQLITIQFISSWVRSNNINQAGHLILDFLILPTLKYEQIEEYFISVQIQNYRRPTTQPNVS